MMKTTNIVTLTVILALVFCSQAAQNAPFFVTIEVITNGKTVPSPPRITLTLGEHSMQVPILNDRFEVPKEIALATKTEDVWISAILGRDQIRTSVTANAFTHEYWSLRLADRRFPDEFQSLIPKGGDPRSACVLTFADKNSDAVFVLDQHCRSKARK